MVLEEVDLFYDDNGWDRVVLWLEREVVWILNVYLYCIVLLMFIIIYIICICLNE